MPKLLHPFFFLLIACTASVSAKSPNIIMMMADDLGWGDVGFNGNEVIMTPHLDAMAEAGVVMKQFYSIGPVCSPTRAACLTGRHNFRTAIWGANSGHLRREEITVSEIAKSKAYATGHFGKWHLGTLSKTITSKGPKRQPEKNFSIPSQHGYDTSFVTESAVGTWDPGYGPRAKNNPFWHDGVALDPEDPESNLKGGAARVVMDRAIPFIEKASNEGKPFLAVIWFHAPHENIMAGPEYLAMYPDAGESAHYYGCITELDEQVGRLQAKLKELGIYEDTLQFFSSDNGPEGGEPKPGAKRAGTTGGFLGRKRSSYEGGVRVPTVAVWPKKIKGETIVDSAACVYDYLPTIAKLTGYTMSDSRPLDGEDMMPILMGKADRAKPIYFRHSSKAWVVRGKDKLIIDSTDDNKQDQLFDLAKDPYETTNINDSSPELASALRKGILVYLASMKRSFEGADYPNVYDVGDSKWPDLSEASKSPDKEKKKPKKKKEGKSE